MVVWGMNFQLVSGVVIECIIVGQFLEIVDNRKCRQIKMLSLCARETYMLHTA